jgi:hypothetical protein
MIVTDMEIVTGRESTFDSLGPKLESNMWSEIDTDSNFTLLYRNSRVHLYFTEQGFQASPAVQKKYLHFLKVLDAWELDGLTTEDCHDWILEICAE